MLVFTCFFLCSCRCYFSADSNWIILLAHQYAYLTGEICAYIIVIFEEITKIPSKSCVQYAAVRLDDSR